MLHRVTSVLALACLAGSAVAQSGKLFVGENGFDPSNPPVSYETVLDSAFPGSVAWSPSFAFAIQGAACTPQNLVYLTSGVFTTDLYLTIPGRAPSRVARTSEAIFDMGYLNGKLYGWAEYASPSGIYEIDPQTGACALRVASTSELFFALDANPADGLLYGFSEYGLTGLYSINPVTGAKHRIAPPPPVASFPNAYGSCRGLAVGNNTVYLCNTWNGGDPNDPQNAPADSYYAYDLSQGDNGVYVPFANPYAGTTPELGGAFWYDPTVIPVLPSPENDHCDHATPVGEGTFAFDNTWADTDGGSTCGGINDVWFLYTPASSHFALFSTSSTVGLDTVVSLYSGGCGGLELDCNDDGGPNPPASSVGAHVDQGVPVLVRVSGYDEAARGVGALTIGECPGITISSQPSAASINRCTATLPSDFSQGNFFVRFTVQASGRDDISYAWFKDGVALSNVGSGSLDDYGIYNTQGFSMLIVRPTAADAGAYACVVSSAACESPIDVTTAPAVLTFCTSDFNCDGHADPDDLSDVIAAYFASPPSPEVDFNHDGAIDPDDLSDYISVYFSGAC